MLYRIVVMGMLVTVVGMAWKVYGPPMESALDLIQDAVAAADQIIVWGGSSEPAKPVLKSVEPSAVGPVTARPIQTHPDALVQPASVSLTPSLEAAPPDSPAVEIAPPAATAEAAKDSGPTQEELLMQLKELGMTEHRLERWGENGALYRFSCRVAPADNPLYARHFESVAADAVLAVTQVAAEVTAWRGN